MPYSKDERITDTRRKALEVNEDATRYGSFAEIGAGQEVVRWFFRAGGAARTISKSMSAYDMTVSDAIYGACDRYVCRERLEAMLDREHALNLNRLGPERGDTTAFFSFADTVAARSRKVTEYWHGWMGIRLQTHPRGEDSQIIIHVRMKDTHNALQQEALGIVGVNLIYGACFLSKQPVLLLESLLDDLTAERIEIDMVEFSGAAFEHVDNRVMSLQLVALGLSNAAMFAPDGTVLQPSDELFKKNVLVERGSFRPVTKVHLDMLRAAREKMGSHKGEIIEIAEISMTNLLENGCWVLPDFIARADLLGAVGKTVLISNYPEHYRLAAYLSSLSRQHVGIAMGAPALKALFDEKYYDRLEGGILESFGRLFKKRTTLYIYPYFDPDSETVLNVDNIAVAHHLRPLFNYLVQQEHIVPIENRSPEATPVNSTEIIDKIASGASGWEVLLPTEAADLIKKHGFFGHTK